MKLIHDAKDASRSRSRVDVIFTFGSSYLLMLMLRYYAAASFFSLALSAASHDFTTVPASRDVGSGSVIGARRSLPPTCRPIPPPPPSDSRESTPRLLAAQQTLRPYFELLVHRAAKTTAASRAVRHSPGGFHHRAGETERLGMPPQLFETEPHGGVAVQRISPKDVRAGHAERRGVKIEE